MYVGKANSGALASIGAMSGTTWASLPTLLPNRLSKPLSKGSKGSKTDLSRLLRKSSDFVAMPVSFSEDSVADSRPHEGAWHSVVSVPKSLVAKSLQKSWKSMGESNCC